MSSFTRGDTVYTEHGAVCEYVAKVDGKHIVMPMYEFPDGGGYTGDPFSTALVFATDDAAKTRVSKKIDEMDSQLRAKREELRELENKLTSFKTEQKTLLAKLKQHEVLKNIEDFLEGKITHFLTASTNSATVKTVQEVLEYKESQWDRGYKFRLLGLYGGTGGDIAWKVSDYRDGSGNLTVVTPFCSLEEALSARDTYLRTTLDKFLSLGLSLNESAKWSVLSLVKVMRSYGLKGIPPEAQTLFDTNDAENKAKKLAEVTAKFNAVQAELRALQGKTG